MTMMTINSTAGLNDLIQLAREIEATENVTRRAALVMALHQWDEITAMCAGNCRYVPVGWTHQPHVSFAVPPMRYADVHPHG